MNDSNLSEGGKDVHKMFQKINEGYRKKYFLISYDEGLKEFNSREFKRMLTSLLLSREVQDLSSPTESTIIFSSLNMDLSFDYWSALIKEHFKGESYYSKGLFFMLFEIAKEPVTNRPLYDGKENEELNERYKEMVEEMKKK